ncbi:hypothetical protein R1sor_020707 [Riccia sorocarpa]|uniref:Uncharacterized protein n=1 Tax=Riccia sorocarpa TaxID=122646 RepID=A0ABD3GGE5_9MARC
MCAFLTRLFRYQPSPTAANLAVTRLTNSKAPRVLQRRRRGTPIGRRRQPYGTNSVLMFLQVALSGLWWKLIVFLSQMRTLIVTVVVMERLVEEACRQEPMFLANIRTCDGKAVVEQLILPEDAAGNRMPHAVMPEPQPRDQMSLLDRVLTLFGLLAVE